MPKTILPAHPLAGQLDRLNTAERLVSRWWYDLTTSGRDYKAAHALRGTPAKGHRRNRQHEKIAYRTLALGHHDGELKAAFFAANPRRKTLPKDFGFAASWGTPR